MSGKIRESLKKCMRRLKDTTPYLPIETFRKYVFADIREAEDALAEPLRNCDVGSPKEQGERFIKFCRRNSFRGVCNDSCKFANVNQRLGWQKIGQAQCFPFWAQLPYENKEE